MLLPTMTKISTSFTPTFRKEPNQPRRNMTISGAQSIKRRAIFTERRMLSGRMRRKNKKIDKKRKKLKRKKMNGKTQAIPIRGSEMRTMSLLRLEVKNGGRGHQKRSKVSTRNISSSIISTKKVRASKTLILNSLREIDTRLKQMQNVGLTMQLAIRNSSQMRSRTFIRIIAIPKNTTQRSGSRTIPSRYETSTKRLTKTSREQGSSLKAKRKNP